MRELSRDQMATNAKVEIAVLKEQLKAEKLKNRLLKEQLDKAMAALAAKPA